MNSKFWVWALLSLSLSLSPCAEEVFLAPKNQDEKTLLKDPEIFNFIPLMKNPLDEYDFLSSLPFDSSLNLTHQEQWKSELSVFQNLRLGLLEVLRINLGKNVYSAEEISSLEEGVVSAAEKLVATTELTFLASNFYAGDNYQTTLNDVLHPLGGILRNGKQRERLIAAKGRLLVARMDDANRKHKDKEGSGSEWFFAEGDMKEELNRIRLNLSNPFIDESAVAETVSYLWQVSRAIARLETLDDKKMDNTRTYLLRRRDELLNFIERKIKGNSNFEEALMSATYTAFPMETKLEWPEISSYNIGLGGQTHWMAGTVFDKDVLNRFLNGLPSFTKRIDAVVPAISERRPVAEGYSSVLLGNPLFSKALARIKNEWLLPLTNPTGQAA